MALRKVVKVGYDGDEILRKPSKEVKKFDENLWDLLDDMWETMNEQDGVGLAAVQVGVLKRVIVVGINGQMIELINPVITQSEGLATDLEGCLSIENTRVYVDRPQKITVQAYDRTGSPFTLTVEGDLARCICHEVDHTNGILITDKVSDKKVDKWK